MKTLGFITNVVALATLTIVGLTLATCKGVRAYYRTINANQSRGESYENRIANEHVQ